MLAMTAVSQLLVYAYHLPLSLIRRTRRQATLLWGLNLIGYGILTLSLSQGGRCVTAATFVPGFIYRHAVAPVFRQRDAA